ncbi:hypothetical protein [Streptomyces sp. WAC05950]|uniref:hypothetical protein n=1 Tax=Streptomyces sp. WAC05950 TaxID=2487419 RepID=UPI000F739D37|nr:hypothetical protein [Streptomyces sp. WAC05950]RST03472.1 hypothetical protein EF904_21025 [Streptomyces sp. WAC05950]
MYLMQQLTNEDREPVSRLIRDRQDHDEREGRPTWDDGSVLLRLMSAPDPATQLVGMWEDEQLVAALAMRHGDPGGAWTDDERAEPSWGLRLVHTHPEHRRLGRLITLWAGDYAARQDRPPTWIRCSVRDMNVAWYLERTCGWAAVRKRHDPSGVLTCLQRAPEHIDHFDLMVATGTELWAEGTLRQVTSAVGE